MKRNVRERKSFENELEALEIFREENYFQCFFKWLIKLDLGEFVPLMRSLFGFLWIVILFTTM